jgi:hypothetical protein
LNYTPSTMNRISYWFPVFFFFFFISGFFFLIFFFFCSGFLVNLIKISKTERSWSLHCPHNLNHFSHVTQNNTPHPPPPFAPPNPDRLVVHLISLKYLLTYLLTCIL